MSEKFKKALRIAVNVGCGFEGDAEDAAELLALITGLESRIVELEGEIDQLTAHDTTERQDDKWIPVSERLPEVNGWYLCGMVSFLGKTFTNEIYFDTVNIDPRWNNPTQDRVYCWLDGVPELPKPPEVK